MRPARLKNTGWKVSTEEMDQRGKPAVLCRNGDREFIFRRGWRNGKDVWVCCERVRMLTNRISQPPDRAEAELAASAAQAELSRLEPEFGIYLDLASENDETNSE